MSAENLDGMSSEQLMLRDIIYEIPDLLRDADTESRDYQRGMYVAFGLLQHQLDAFQIDQSRFARQIPDLEAWFHRGQL